VIADKACIYCGYDLTGLTAQDVCPQCGKPAGYSLLGDHLRDVESTWLKQVVLGITLLVGAYCVLVSVRGDGHARLLASKIGKATVDRANAWGIRPDTTGT